MDVMGGVISGAAFGGDVRNQFEEAKHRRTGVPFLAKEVAKMQEAATTAGLRRLVVSTAPLDGAA